MYATRFPGQAEELDQDQDQNWIIDPKNVEVLDQKDHLGSVDPEIWQNLWSFGSKKSKNQKM